MPIVLVYSPSDFIVPPPAESGAAAAGTAPFTLVLRPDAKPTAIDIADNDQIINEIDSSQVLSQPADLDGQILPAGTTVNTAYDLINSTTGHKVTALHFGGDGYQQGPIDGIISTVALQPGQIYTFNIERTSYQQQNEYSDYVACLARDTRVRTDRGEVAVQDLAPGDLVQTQDHGRQPLRLLLSRRVRPAELTGNPKLRPVRITAGAMGNGLPVADLLVSPQHRMLVASPIVQRMFSQPEVLIAAKKLTAIPGIFVDMAATWVEYFHLVFDDHQIIFAEGAPTESFLAAPIGIAALSDEAQAEFRTLFGQPGIASPARMIPENRRQRDLAARHAKNAKDLL